MNTRSVMWKVLVLSLLTIAFPVLSHAQELNLMKCDKYKDDSDKANDCGEAPPHGLCGGTCSQTTYTEHCGLCTYTGYFWNDCASKPVWSIQKVTHSYQCDIELKEFLELKVWICICTEEEIMSDQQSETKLCDCNS